MTRRTISSGLLAILLAVPIVGQTTDPVVDMLRLQVDIEKRLLLADLSNLERVVGQLRGASDRMTRLADDLLRAEKEGEEAASFSSRSADLRRSEAEVGELVAVGQQIRATVAARRGYLEQVQAELKQMQESAVPGKDELSGRWVVAIEPGGLTGTFDLHLDGTLVSGVYQLSGGWKGSLRGTFIGNGVRLERIDAQLGFAAVYTARLVARAGEKRLEGTWDATNLAAGMPVSGTWVGQREAGRQ
jgi:hypothetical protein